MNTKSDKHDVKSCNTGTMPMMALILSICTTGIISAGCNSPEKKVEKAQEHVAEANKELEEANKQYAEDVANYRKISNDRIEANRKSIAEFNARVAKEKKEARADYEKRIADIEQKNNDLKKKLDDYKAEGRENWEKFKLEFNRDMDELGQSLKDLTVKKDNKQTTHK